MPYTPQTQLSAPARDSAEIWRTALGAVMVTGFYFAGVFAAAFVMVSMLGQSTTRTLTREDTPLGMIVLLTSYGLLIFAVFATMRVLHRRDARSLLGPLVAARRDFLRVALPLLGLTLLLLPLTTGSDQVGRHLSLSTWLLWLPLALPAILIQSGAEELVFRGYLQSQLSARLRSPLIWIGLPSLLFGLLHL